MSSMEEEGKPIELRALDSLGLGFDFTSDFRLKYTKGDPPERLIVVNEANKREVVFPGGLTVQGVSADIRCDKGERVRFKSDILEFNQMSELLNQKASVQGKVPSGYLNAIFDLSGHWLNDAADTKCLSFDAYFIALYYLHLTTSPLVLKEKVKNAVPSHWDPAALSRFIRTYGTHVIVGVGIGGQDVVCVKQKHSSTISSVELREHLDELGDFLFSDGGSSAILQRKSREGKQKVPEVFSRILEAKTIQFTSVSETSSKDGVTVIWSKRGGDVFSHNHFKWLQTVAVQPDAILFKFVPITSLLTGVPGSGYLSHAINLYMRYKPLPDDLQQFLEFQVPSQWAPMYGELPLGHMGRQVPCPSLQFSFMGPKVYVSSSQVSSCHKPVVGLRLYLEGRRCNRLAIHMQHLSSMPHLMLSSLSNNSSSRWCGSDDYNSNHEYIEPVNWRRFSNVCTSVVKHDPNWLQEERSNGVYIVTGAQLLSKGMWPRTVLHLRLLFTHLSNHCIRKTEWAAAHEASRKSNFLTNLSTTFTFSRRSITDQPKQTPAALNSGICADGPPVPVRFGKLLRYVDMGEVVRGPHDSPGHWLVTAAKLVTEGGKITLHVKFALLDYLKE